jgi:DNA-directed RNA polymerase sigma subunit (sigma70/sigma32)
MTKKQIEQVKKKALNNLKKGYKVGSMQEELNKRNKEILQMRQNRYTLREIGNKFGISKERVRQIEMSFNNKIKNI